MARLWSVSHRHGYVTPADFVRGRYGSRGLSLAVAVTGILATMPYIALQLVGIQAVLEVVGRRRRPATSLAKDLPLFIAFAVLAAYTYSSRPARAGADRVRQGHPDLPRHHRRDHLPAVEVRRLGRTSSTRPRRRWRRPTRPTASRPGSFIPASAQYWAYATLALGSALALFMYPHSITGGAVVQEPQHDPPQRRDPAGVPLRARPARAARLRRDRGRHQADRSRRQAQRRSWSSRSCSRTRSRRGSPGSPSRRSRSARSCRRRSCRSRRPTCSPATSTRSGSSPDATVAAGGQGLQDRLAGGQVVRAAVRAHAGQAERDQLPAARRDLDPADASRPSCSASTPDGSTAGRCSPAGRSA